MKIPDNIIKENFEDLFVYVSNSKRERISKFRRREDSYRSLLAELLVRVSLCKKLEIKNSDIAFIYNKYGKPYLSSEKGSMYFNLSHSALWVACIVDNEEVGIDIERFDSLDSEMAKSCLSGGQYERFLELNERERVEYFNKMWVLKESYIKFDGRGLSIPLKTITFQNEKDFNDIRNRTEDGKQLYFHLYQIEPNCWLSACATTPHFPIKINMVSYESVLENIKYL